ncbi:alpha/beta fold hydrolase [Sphingobacterium psychroaquaticum]|uniref:alpha/beta fold hydrolase n=1 Tax=Sphingobacterium psychroaquaticum TaxID=561061 RepID=UPI00106B04D6|nr:alpha/beta fold hydrolase [Sphingobacterium psychroaquaticum]QBQ41583.1 alpha/beta fold hydrolase [Sphingobacterium psychroaquaticum]
MAERLIKSNKLRVADISLHYYIKKATATEKKTIIFLHGFPFNKNMWRQQLSQVADDTTAIALDIRGHGNSTSGHGFFSVDLFAKDLKEFIEKLGLEKVVLCGISMGGYIALRAYQLYPEKISGLILADTHSKADDDSGKQKRFDSIQAVLTHGRRPFAIGFIEKVFAPNSLDSKPEAVELIKSSIRRNSIRTICATLLALASRTDTSSVLPTIDCPTLIIRGELDRITAKEDMQALASAIKNSNYIEMANCGHLPNLEAPEEFNKLLLHFLLEINA